MLGKQSTPEEHIQHKHSIFSSFFISGTGFSNQALYYLSHTSSPFCSGYFGDGGLANYLGWPRTLILLILASQIARIIHVSHLHPANTQFLSLKKVHRVI
jgi:hypothetical protein